MCNVTEDLWCMMKHSAISMQPDGSEEPRSIGTSVSCNGRLSQVLSTNFIICLSTLSASVVINVIYLAFFCCCVFFKLDILQVSTSYQFNLYCPGIWDLNFLVLEQWQLDLYSGTFVLKKCDARPAGAAHAPYQ